MKFSNHYEKLFEKAVLDFCDKKKGKDRDTQKEYTLFYPMIGKNYETNRDIFL